MPTKTYRCLPPCGRKHRLSGRGKDGSPIAFNDYILTTDDPVKQSIIEHSQLFAAQRIFIVPELMEPAPQPAPKAPVTEMPEELEAALTEEPIAEVQNEIHNDALEGLTYKELQNECKTRGLPAKGSKAELIERLSL